LPTVTVRRSSYVKLSGTSMSAGLVTGVVALLAEVQPSLRPNVVKAILEYTALPTQDTDGQPASALAAGAGALNAAGALTLARAIRPTATVGSAWLTEAVSDTTVIDGERLTWGHTIAWGNLTTTAPILSGNELAWATNIVWGNATTWSVPAMWSGDVTVTTAPIWAANIVWGNSLVGVVTGGNIVWGNFTLDNIVWGNLSLDNIVWGNLFDLDNIVWGNDFLDNIVWGNTTAARTGGVW
jgi:hypothetical protein